MLPCSRWSVRARFTAAFVVGALFLFVKLAHRTAIAASDTRAAIDGLVLEQNYPNPFTTTTEIEYYIPVGGHVLMRVFNTLGQEVGRPVDDDKPANKYAVKFDGSTLPSGQYTYTLFFTSDADKSTGKLTKKMYLLR